MSVFFHINVIISINLSVSDYFIFFSSVLPISGIYLKYFLWLIEDTTAFYCKSNNNNDDVFIFKMPYQFL